jgi:hypothetical protein
MLLQACSTHATSAASLISEIASGVISLDPFGSFPAGSTIPAGPF